MSDERPSTQRVALPNGDLVSSCSECWNTETQRDKGLGRAVLAAWESRHGQNCHRVQKGSSTTSAERAAADELTRMAHEDGLT